MDSISIEVQIDRILLNKSCLSWEIVMHRRDRGILDSIDWPHFNIEASEVSYDDDEEYVHFVVHGNSEDVLLIVLMQLLGKNTYYVYPLNEPEISNPYDTRQQ